MSAGAGTVADAVADEFARCGVDRVFGVPGGEVLLLIDALRRHGIDYALCRHEASAGIAAAVYGKLRGTAGVVLTTLGPGAANLLLPLANSLLDREPLVAISAQTPASWSPYRTHQKLPLLEALGPIAKAAGALRAGSCRSLVGAAVAAATAEPQGPVFLTLTTEDAQAAEADGGDTAALVRRGEEALPRMGAREAAGALEDRLGSARRPLVVVGLGTRPEAAQPLRAWLGRWRLPVAVTPKVKGIVDETDEAFVGVVGGMALDREVREALAASDLVVGFGLDPVEIDGAWHLELPLLWVLESVWATGIAPADDVVAVDHLELLELLGAPPRCWGDPFAGLRARRAAVAVERPRGRGADPVSLVRALAAAAPAETIVATDVGAHKYVLAQFWPSRSPQTFLVSNGLSGMGYGIPAALGAKLARPSSPVLAVLGDGGFSMNSQELETARRLGAPFVTVVLADDSYSLIAVGQESRGLPRYGVDFSRIDSVLTARACGVEALRTDDVEELGARVAAALDAGEPLLAETPIDPAGYRGIV
jgi:acetolactate synthase-1/2/3 large subunit